MDKGNGEDKDQLAIQVHVVGHISVNADQRGNVIVQLATDPNNPGGRHYAINADAAERMGKAMVGAAAKARAANKEIVIVGAGR